MTNSEEQPHLDHFFKQLKTARQRALLLDYDGTLAPFHVDRHCAMPYPQVHALLQALLDAAHTRIIIISGRFTRELPPLLNLTPLPEIWGSHGHERLLPDGRYTMAPLGPDASAILTGAHADLERAGLAHSCEQKPASLAVHWRGLPPAQQESLRVHTAQYWSSFADHPDLRVIEFDGGVELAARSRDKGAAVRTVLAEMGEDYAVAYLGDDTTDEDAFKALSGKGLGVLVRDRPRATAADVRITPPEGLLAFLARWHAVAESTQQKMPGTPAEEPNL